jgi:hypothetical protein
MTVRNIHSANGKAERMADLPAAPSAMDRGCARRAAAVLQLATDIIARMEQRFREDPLAIVEQQAGTQPREIEEAQSYFKEKMEHIRESLRELADLLRLSPDAAEKPDLIRGELLAFFVLVESLRPARDAEAGPNVGEASGRLLCQAFDSLSLDVINLRQRLK